MTTAVEKKSKVILCQCAFTRILPSQVKTEVRAGLDQAGVEYEEVSDLCKLAAHQDPKLDELANEEGMKIAACYPRAVKWLFHSAGKPLDEEKVEVLNLREQSSQEVVAEITGEKEFEIPDVERAFDTKPDEDWKPWFPVIDFDRCTNCMQCLSFCLFDVYGVDEGKIKVNNPTKCKTDCPACSRVCPEAAIMFPKYKAGPINGAPVSDEDLRREKMKVDITSLLGGDIYSILKDRTAKAKSRFSKERDEERAIKERKRCLKKLQDALDIPAEVMNALPTPDAIRNKADTANEGGA